MIGDCMLGSVRRRVGARGALVVMAVSAVTLLTSCGGASNANGPDDPIVATAQACSPNNPFRTDATGPITAGSLTIEKAWLRSYIDRQYLWFEDMPNPNPSARNYSDESNVVQSLVNYFFDLLTPRTTSSGTAVDQFSFVASTAEWDALINSGSSLGYGIEWQAVLTAPRSVRVAYVHAGSPAATAGVLRGDTLLQADGADITTMTEANLEGVLYPATTSSHAFRFSRGGVTQSADVSLTPTSVTLTSVQAPQVLSVGGQNVGYLLFNDHVLTAEQPLINAFTTLQNAGVSDLVLDLRYNGGGYLYIASQVAYMIAGPARTNGQVFERTLFNSKRQSENSSTEFIDVACIPDPTTFTCTSSASLPTLNLARVFILASDSTCSASEAIINGLRGVGVDVRLIGSTTCGKPYGFFGQDNCGLTYFPIEFQGVNADGFGDYADGFVPGASNNGNNVNGCEANDDLDHPLGNPAEGQLAQALFHRAGGTCMAVQFGSSRASPLALRGAKAPASVIKPAALTNRNGRKPVR